MSSDGIGHSRDGQAQDLSDCNQSEPARQLQRSNDCNWPTADRRHPERTDRSRLKAADQAKIAPPNSARRLPCCRWLRRMATYQKPRPSVQTPWHGYTEIGSGGSGRSGGLWWLAEARLPCTGSRRLQHRRTEWPNPTSSQCLAFNRVYRCGTAPRARVPLSHQAPHSRRPSTTPAQAPLPAFR